MKGSLGFSIEIRLRIPPQVVAKVPSEITLILVERLPQDSQGFLLAVPLKIAPEAPLGVSPEVSLGIP